MIEVPVISKDATDHPWWKRMIPCSSSALVYRLIATSVSAPEYKTLDLSGSCGVACIPQKGVKGRKQLLCQLGLGQ